MSIFNCQLSIFNYLCLSGLLWLCCAASACAQGLQLEDPLLPHAPQTVRSEAEEDRLHAAALFAAARMLEQKGEMDAALRRYQRAARYDDQALPILREIVPLAFSVGRSQEAIRYALIAVEKDPTDPALMRRLALYLAEQGQWRRSLELYELLLDQLQAGDNAAESVQVHLEIGRLYFLTEQFDEAAESFAVVQKALADPDMFGLDQATRESLEGDAHLTWSLFAESYLASGKFDQAEAAFRRAHETQPNPGILGYQLARVEAKRNNPGKALELLRGYFNEKEQSESIAPYALLVELLTDLDQEATIDEQFEALHMADPDNPLLSYFLARRYLDEDKLSKAESLLQQLAEDDSDDAPQAEVHEALIELYVESGQNVELLEALSAGVALAQTLEPYDDQIQPLLADRARVEQLFELSRQHRAAGEKPEGEVLAVAQLALQAEAWDVAAEFFAHALADEPDRQAEILLTWGLELFLAEQYKAAAEVFQQGVNEKQLPDDNPGFYYYLAGALEMAGKTDKALAAAGKAAELQPDSPEFASRVAWIQYHADRLEEARQAYLELLEKYDEHQEPEAVRDVMREARLVLSNIDVERDDLKSAEEWLEQVLDEYPQDIGAMNDLGYLWADQNKRLARARKMIEQAVAEEPDNRAYQDSLGWVLYRQGEYEQAVEILEKAAAGEDPDGVILDHLGDGYEKIDQGDKARDAWRRSIEAFEEHDQPDEAAAVREKIEAE